jgi:hypothetical protein
LRKDLLDQFAHATATIAMGQRHVRVFDHGGILFGDVTSASSGFLRV